MNDSAKTLFGWPATGLLALCLLAGAAAAAPEKADDEAAAEPEKDAWPASQAGRMELKEKEHILGVPFVVEDLRQKVVLVFYWDQNAKCLEMLGTIARLDATYRRKGLVVISANKNRQRKVIVSAMKARGADFAVFAEVEVPGMDKTRLAKYKVPYCIVLDHTGKVTYEHPPSSKMVGAIQSALSRRPNPLTGTRKYKKSAGILARIRGRRLGEAVKLCEQAKEKQGEDAEAAEEAAVLMQNIQRHAKQLAGLAERCKEKAPHVTQDLLKQLAKEFAGTPQGKEADEKVKLLAKDEAFQNRIKVDRECRAVFRALARVPKLAGNAKDSQKRSWYRTYGPLLRSVKTKIADMKKKYPDVAEVDDLEETFLGILPAKK